VNEVHTGHTVCHRNNFLLIDLLTLREIEEFSP
jgi:hypothetical protein